MATPVNECESLEDDVPKRLNGLSVSVSDQGEKVLFVEPVWRGLLLAAFAVMPFAVWYKQDFATSGFQLLLPMSTALLGSWGLWLAATVKRLEVDVGAGRYRMVHGPLFARRVLSASLSTLRIEFWNRTVARHRVDGGYGGTSLAWVIEFELNDGAQFNYWHSPFEKESLAEVEKWRARFGCAVDDRRRWALDDGVVVDRRTSESR